MPDQPTVRVGQEWADNDPRQQGKRLLKVLRLDEENQRVWRPSLMEYETVTTAYAVVRQLVAGELVGPYRRIRLDRFRPTSTGYRLVSYGCASPGACMPPLHRHADVLLEVANA